MRKQLLPLLALFALLIIALVAVQLRGEKFPAGVAEGGTSIATAVPIGGAFNLVDENGQNVTEQNYATTKKLVFFGFTFCPSICPGELLKISDILNALQGDASKITPLFITVDPARDTADMMKSYTDKFDPRIIGLTGAPEQIEATLKSFRTYAARIGEGADYMMDHSAYLYLTDEDNHMIGLYKIDQTADEIAVDLKKRL